MSAQRSTAMAVRFRAAERSDVEALARFADLASRGSGPLGPFDLAFPGPEPERLATLARIAATPTVGWLHWSLFRVAEADGRVAAGAAGLAADEVTTDERVRAVLGEIGWSEEEIDAAYERLAPALSALPPPPPGAWTIDHVATLPEYRGRGLVSTLLDQVLEEGRRRGFPFAQLDVLIGNDGARRIYERAGFRVVAEYVHPEFQRVLGSPGNLRMVKEPI